MLKTTPMALPLVCIERAIAANLRSGLEAFPNDVLPRLGPLRLAYRCGSPPMAICASMALGFGRDDIT